MDLLLQKEVKFSKFFHSCYGFSYLLSSLGSKRSHIHLNAVLNFFGNRLRLGNVEAIKFCECEGDDFLLELLKDTSSEYWLQKKAVSHLNLLFKHLKRKKLYGKNQKELF